MGFSSWLVSTNPFEKKYITLRILGMLWGVKLPPVLRPQGCHERRVVCVSIGRGQDS